MGCVSSKSVRDASRGGEEPKQVILKVRKSPLARTFTGGVPPVEHDGAPRGREKEGTDGPVTMPNEAKRLEETRKFAKLDGKAKEKDPRLDEITKLVCTIFDVPIAIVSLLDKDTLWFKSVQGLGDATSCCRKESMCAWTLIPDHPEVLVIPNCADDVRFSANPLVAGPPGIRFYAGAPLRKEREMRRSRTAAALKAAECAEDGLVLIDIASPGWSLAFLNDACVAMTGVGKDAVGKSLWGEFELLVGPNETQEAKLAVCMIDASRRRGFSMTFQRAGADGEAPATFVGDFRPATTDLLVAPEGRGATGVPSFVAGTPADGLPEGKAGNYFLAVVHRVNAPHPELRWRPAPPHPWDDVVLGGLIGTGSYSKVFRAALNGKPIAVKIIAADVPFCKDWQLRWAASLRRLDNGEAHPNIVHVLRTSSRGNKEAVMGAPQQHEAWLAIDLADCGSLRDAIDRGQFFTPRHLGDAGPLQPSIPGIKAAMLEIASAMAFLHNQGILHGGLSGSNVLLVSSTTDPRGFMAKVSDYGLAGLLGAAITSGTYGSVTHMAPELLTEGKMSQAMDSFSFGVLLWEICTGERPWAGLLSMQIIFNVTMRKKRLQFPRDLPAALRTLGEECLAEDPAQRPNFPTIVERLQAL